MASLSNNHYWSYTFLNPLARSSKFYFVKFTKKKFKWCSCLLPNDSPNNYKFEIKLSTIKAIQKKTAPYILPLPVLPCIQPLAVPTVDRLRARRPGWWGVNSCIWLCHHIITFPSKNVIYEKYKIISYLGLQLCINYFFNYLFVNKLSVSGE